MEMKTVPVFCGKDCGGCACPLMARIEGGRVTRITNNPAGGEYLKGCRRGFNLHLETYAEDRLLTPLIRSGERGSGQFRQASWDEALQLTADRLSEIRTKYGATAVLNRSSAGATTALGATWSLPARFLNLFGGCTRLYGSYSNGASGYVLPYLLGKEWSTSGFDAATMQYAEMIILWGANVWDTRQGTEVPYRLVEASQRGAQIVVIDPRHSATAGRAANWWIPCRPGTDAALMLAVLYVLFTENLADRGFIQSHSTGFEALERYVLGQDGREIHSPRWASEICGIPEDEIVRFARAYAAAKPAMLFPGYSIQRVFAGEETYRLSVALQIATGNFGKRGGSTGSMNSLLPTPRIGRLAIPELPDLPAVPVLRWPDAILEGKSGGYPSDIHGIYNVGSNSINQGGDIHKNIAAFKKVDFVVTHEIFMTPTARYSDVILPVATILEKEDIGIPWLGNFLVYKAETIAPAGQARSDYDIFCDLAERLGFEPEFSEGRSAAGWIQHFIDQSEITDPDEFRRTGIYLAPDQERVGLAEFNADPVGHPLSTPSGKVEIASQKYASMTGFSAIPTWQPVPKDNRFPLQLITPKSAYRVHSQSSNIEAIRAKEPHVLSMHPQDAAQRGIVDGDWVKIFNLEGAGKVPVKLTEDIVSGVVSLPEGIWVDLDEAGVDQAGSANMFTSTDGTQPGINCIMHGMGVEVSRLTA